MKIISQEKSFEQQEHHSTETFYTIYVSNKQYRLRIYQELTARYDWLHSVNNSSIELNVGDMWQLKCVLDDFFAGLRKEKE